LQTNGGFVIYHKGLDFAGEPVVVIVLQRQGRLFLPNLRSIIAQLL